MTIIEALDTGLVELGPGNHIKMLNGAAEQCLAGHRGRLGGLALDELDAMPADLLQAIDATRKDSRTRRLHECHFQGGFYDCGVQALEGGDVLLELYDLEWQRQKQQIQQSEVQTGLLDLMRRNLGHEIRNPLGGIRGAAQMMADELGEQELGTLARLIMREVDRVDELIKRFWQPEAEREAVDIHLVIEEILQLLQAETGSQPEVKRDYDPSIPELSGDSVALHRMLLNLVRNAAQAEAGHILIKTRMDHGSGLGRQGQGALVRLDIEDDGTGVPEALRPMLFLPMVTGRRDGTGLGLALAQQIAVSHDGMVTYEPMPQGSRFSVRLPVTRTAEADAHGS